jgi:hypothetical protein
MTMPKNLHSPFVYQFARNAILRLSFIPFFLISLCTGCVPYKIPTETFIPPPVAQPVDPKILTNYRQAAAHPLYQLVPRHRSQIHWYDIGHWISWTLFGNDDDGVFGENSPEPYLPEKKIGLKKALRWTCRNPFHNFCFYVIGSAHRINSEFTLLKIDQREILCCTYKPKGETNFGQGNAFYLGFHGWKPFISLQILYSPKHLGQFYMGWRERGNFGIKFLPFVKNKTWLSTNCG